MWLLDTNTIIYAQYLAGRAKERLDDSGLRFSSNSLFRGAK